jgi:LmbE family N-acetylglucosaminyl deacetylase
VSVFHRFFGVLSPQNSHSNLLSFRGPDHFLNWYFRRLPRVPNRTRAIIIAPHPDDETLGCGATISRKIAEGETVDIVFMTNGSRSHVGNGVFNIECMIEMRKTEALRACSILGVGQNSVHFLGFEDGLLTESVDAASEKVLNIFCLLNPSEVFVPYLHDGHADHTATNIAVRQALKNFNKGIMAYQYPVWFLAHWPFVISSHLDTGALLRNWAVFIKRFYHLLTEMRYSIPIGKYRITKQEALNAHQSQMVRFADGHWPTLHDVSNGEFLEMFFLECEPFAVMHY